MVFSHLVVLISIIIGSTQVNSADESDESCEFTGRISFLAERGETTRLVNYTLPVTDAIKALFPEPPVLLKDGERQGLYILEGENRTVCRFELYLTVLRCNISELQEQTNLILDRKCDDLAYGQTCLGYCPAGSLSTATHLSFTCESRDNSTYWDLGQTDCSGSGTPFKCPEDMTFYLERYDSYTNLNWTLPNVPDGFGQSWNVTYQSMDPQIYDYIPKRYEEGKYTNIVGAINSKGQTSSCEFGIEVKVRTCPIPSAEDSTLLDPRRNKTRPFREYSRAEQICKHGYLFPERFRKRWDTLTIECTKNTTSGELYWKNWDKYICNRTYMPHTSETNLYLKDQKRYSGRYDFVYNTDEWKAMKKQGRTECLVRARRTTEQTTPYNLEVSFTTDNAPSRDKCFFQALLFTGSPGANSPMKVFDCTLSESVKMKWPTSEFVVVFRLFDNFTENSDTIINGNGTINYKFTECSDCDFKSMSGLTKRADDIPLFDYSPVAPCRLTACLEDALEGYKLRLHAQTKDDRLYIFNERCEANIRLQTGVTKICVKQTKPKQKYLPMKFDDECREDADKYLRTVQFKLRSGYQLEAWCDDVLNWWCFPVQADDNFLNVSWKGGYSYGPRTQQMWVISVSDNEKGQTCSEPIIATTTPRPKRVIKIGDSNDNRMTYTIVGAVLSTLAGLCTCIGGATCYKKRKKNNSGQGFDGVPMQ